MSSAFYSLNMHALVKREDWFRIAISFYQNNNESLNQVFGKVSSKIILCSFTIENVAYSKHALVKREYGFRIAISDKQAHVNA